VIESLKKQGEESNALLRRLLRLNRETNIKMSRPLQLIFSRHFIAAGRLVVVSQ